MSSTSDFPHGLRVYHRVREQYGVVVVHPNLWTDSTSVCVQFDGSPDIAEVTKKLLNIDCGPAKHQPGDKVRVLDAEAIVVRVSEERPFGRDCTVRFASGIESTINENRLEKVVTNAA